MRQSLLNLIIRVLGILLALYGVFYIFGTLFFNNLFSISGLVGLSAGIGGGLASFNSIKQDESSKIIFIACSIASVGAVAEIIEYYAFIHCPGNSFGISGRIPFYFILVSLTTYTFFILFKKRNVNS